MIRDELRTRSTDALRRGDTVSRLRLSAILGAFTTHERSPGFRGWTEDEERKVVSTYIGGLRKALDLMPPSMSTTHPYVEEIEMLSEFAPAPYDEAKTESVAQALIDNGPITMNEFMRRMMKDTNAGKQGLLDGVIVRKIGQKLGVK